jgi:hypothetical protein
MLRYSIQLVKEIVANAFQLIILTTVENEVTTNNFDTEICHYKYIAALSTKPPKHRNQEHFSL